MGGGGEKVSKKQADKELVTETIEEEVEVHFDPDTADAAAELPDLAVNPEEEVEKTKRAKRRVILSVEEEMLMSEWLHEHPEIYSEGMKAYKDVGKKNRLWESKADDMERSVRELKTWYDSIRTRIGNLYTKSGAPAKDLTDRDQFPKVNFSFLGGSHIQDVRPLCLHGMYL